MEDTDDNLDSWWYYYLAIAIAITGGLVLVVILVLLFSVKRTFEILRLSARPLKNVPLILFAPLAQLLVGALIVVGLFASTMAIVTIANIDERVYEG
jgi:hypothetical protein